MPRAHIDSFQAACRKWWLRRPTGLSSSSHLNTVSLSIHGRSSTLFSWVAQLFNFVLLQLLLTSSFVLCILAVRILPDSWHTYCHLMEKPFLGWIPFDCCIFHHSSSFLVTLSPSIFCHFVIFLSKPFSVNLLFISATSVMDSGTP